MTVPNDDSQSPIIRLLACVAYAGIGALAGAAYAWIPKGTASVDERSALMLPLAIVGAVTGPILYLTRAWRRRDHVRALLAWTLGGALGGLIVGGIGMFGEPGGIRPALLGAPIGAFMATMSRYLWWTHLHGGADDSRSASERRGQTLVFALSAIPVLIMLLLTAA